VQFWKRLSDLRLRPASLWRYRAPLSPEEIRRTEQWLATARVFLAISALAGVWMDPGEIRSLWAYALLDFYIVQGTAVIFLLRAMRESTTSFRLVVHGADIVWPALISLFTTSQSNPFFLFFVFVIAAAAYRWGLWETVMTAVSSVGLLWLESLLISHGHLVPTTWNVDTADLEPRRLVMRSVYLVIMGFLLGYLADQQKKLRAERDVAARMLRLVRLDEGLAATLNELFREVLTIYGARKVIVASRESGTPRISVGTFELKRGIIDAQWIDAGAHGSEVYLNDAFSETFYAAKSNGTWQRDTVLMSLEPDGKLQRRSAEAIARFAGVHPFRKVIAVSYSFGLELSGRMFVIDLDLKASLDEELPFIHDLIRQVSPAVYNLYLLRRLRRRAGALERARLVRELHDGAVQSLIGVEMQVDVMRRSFPQAGTLAGELERIQHLLREEVLKLRELMQQMKSADMDGRRLPGFLRDTVQKFQRETGITARLLLDDEDVNLSPPVCRELARIVQEALVNVRKHSGAHNVLVQLLEAQGRWELIIEDDGIGFAFNGRVPQIELDSSGRAPAIIRERVRLIGGELTIESKAGRGARVEVSVPVSIAQAIHG